MQQETPSAGDSLNERARRADRIVRNPAKYKICAGCESIIAEKVAICPNCHAYRFVVDADRVVAQAQELGQREARSVLATDMD